jgi:hypothetical protein
MLLSSLPGRLAGVAVIACVAALAPAAASAATSSSLHAEASVPRCSTSDLLVWLNVPPGNDYAGGAFYYLEFNNQSGHACTLRGSPGVSAVSLKGRQLGSAAGGDYSGGVPAIMLANGATATAKLQIADTGIFGTRCFATQPSPRNPGILPIAAGLRVYPPNQTASKVVPYPLQACARPGPVYMSVSPVALSVVAPGI